MNLDRSCGVSVVQYLSYPLERHDPKFVRMNDELSGENVNEIPVSENMLQGTSTFLTPWWLRC